MLVHIYNDSELEEAILPIINNRIKSGQLATNINDVFSKYNPSEEPRSSNLYSLFQYNDESKDITPENLFSKDRVIGALSKIESLKQYLNDVKSVLSVTYSGDVFNNLNNKNEGTQQQVEWGIFADGDTENPSLISAIDNNETQQVPLKDVEVKKTDYSMLGQSASLKKQISENTKKRLLDSILDDEKDEEKKEINVENVDKIGKKEDSLLIVKDEVKVERKEELNDSIEEKKIENINLLADDKDEDLFNDDDLSELDKKIASNIEFPEMKLFDQF